MRGRASMRKFTYTATCSATKTGAMRAKAGAISRASSEWMPRITPAKVAKGRPRALAARATTTAQSARVIHGNHDGMTLR